MAAPTLTFRDSGGDALISAVSLTATAGVPGVPVTIQLTHDGGDPLRDGKLKGFVRDPSATTWQREAHEWGSAGVPQARISGGLGGFLVSTTAWTSIGAGSYLALPDLASGEGIELEFRLDAPPDTTIQTAQINPVVTNDRGEEVGVAPSLIMGDGIVLPLRDRSAFALVYSSGPVVENPGGADDQVQIPQLVWIGAGVPLGLASYLETIDDLDGNGDALTSGQAYKLRLTCAADGTITQTKGIKAAAASAEASAWPADEPRLATVTRAFDGLINNVDIDDAQSLDLFGWSDALLVGTIGGGRNALVDGSVIYATTPSNATLGASTTNAVYLNRDGSLTVSPAGTPAGRSLLIHEADTDGSGVTEHRDRRGFIGFSPAELVFRWDGLLTANTYRYAHVPGGRDAYVLPVGGVSVSIGVQATTPASGATTFDLEYYDGATWVSIFPTSANRPSIAYNAADLDLVNRSIYPESLVLPAGAPLRAKIAAVPAGSAAAPSDACLILRLAA